MASCSAVRCLCAIDVGRTEGETSEGGRHAAVEMVKQYLHAGRACHQPQPAGTESAIQAHVITESLRTELHKSRQMARHHAPF